MRGGGGVEKVGMKIAEGGREEGLVRRLAKGRQGMGI